MSVNTLYWSAVDEVKWVFIPNGNVGVAANGGGAGTSGEGAVSLTFHDDTFRIGEWLTNALPMHKPCQSIDMDLLIYALSMPTTCRSVDMV